MTYQLLKSDLGNGGVILTDEQGRIFIIPNNPENRDWKAYLVWVAAGNAATPAAS